MHDKNPARSSLKRDQSKGSDRARRTKIGSGKNSKSGYFSNWGQTKKHMATKKDWKK